MAFNHNSKTHWDEPKWSEIDKTKLPRIAFADQGEEGTKSTWKYPHHWVKGGDPANVDEDGIYTDGTMYLAEKGLEAAWSAAMGAHTGEKADQAIIDHLQSHRNIVNDADEFAKNREGEPPDSLDNGQSTPPAPQGDPPAPEKIENSDPPAIPEEAERIELDEAPSQIESKGKGVFDVTLIDFSRPTGTGIKFSNFDCAGAVPKFANCVSFADHRYFERPDGVRQRSVRDAIALCSMPRLEGQAIKARYEFIDSESHECKVATAVAQAKASDPSAELDIGLSPVIWLSWADKSAKEAASLAHTESVDMVFRPAAGGAFDRILNSLSLEFNDTGALQEKAPASDLEGGPTVTAEELAQMEAKLKEQQDTLEAQRVELSNTMASAKELREAQTFEYLSMAITKADLPEALSHEVWESFCETDDDGKRTVRREFSVAEIDAGVKRFTDLQAKLVENKVVQASGNRIQVGFDTLDKVQFAMDSLFGVFGLGLDGKEDPAALSAKGSFEEPDSIARMYIMLTGDKSWEGQFQPSMVELAMVNATTFASVFKNALNKVLIKEWDENVMWWEPICTVYPNMLNLQNPTSVVTQTMGELPEVTGTYDEIDWDDSEETTSWNKKGGYIGIDEDDLINDDIGAILRVPKLISNAAYKAVSALVSGVFTANSGVGPNMADGTAVFDGSRSNLRTTALGVAAFETAANDMATQSPAGDTDWRLTARPRFLLVPSELFYTGQKIETSDDMPLQNANTGTEIQSKNVHAGTFTTIEVPDFTDANDWALVADPKRVECIQLFFYRNRQKPELFVQSNPLTGGCFSDDEIRIKGRLRVARGVADFRGLHKSNVVG